jgi:signal transduction histidine kinase
MTRLSAAAVGLAAVAAAAIGVASLGDEGTILALAVLVAIGVATVASTRLVLAARRRGRAGPLSRELAVAVAIVLGPLLLALLLLSLLMFVSGHDAALVAVIAIFTGVLGVVAANRLSAAVIADIEAVRDGLIAVGRGERQLRISTDGRDELREPADAANAMIDRLADEEAARDKSEEARRHLVAAVSHDLRTPITSLRLLAEAIDDRVVDGELRGEYVSRMRTHIDALGALIDDLFELSRLEAGDISWSLERVPLGELVSETVAAMRVHAELKGWRSTPRSRASCGRPTRIRRSSSDWCST